MQHSSSIHNPLESHAWWPVTCPTIPNTGIPGSHNSLLIRRIASKDGSPAQENARRPTLEDMQCLMINTKLVSHMR
jgi:hypothetical protein